MGTTAPNSPHKYQPIYSMLQRAARQQLLQNPANSAPDTCLSDACAAHALPQLRTQAFTLKVCLDAHAPTLA